MTKEISMPAVHYYQSPPYARIHFDADADALCFIVSNAEVFRLTPDGMKYKGQDVWDGGVAYREIRSFFIEARKTMNFQSTSGTL